MYCWARYIFVGIVAVLGIGHIVTACGQKGDLYLPEPERAPSASPQAHPGDDVPVPRAEAPSAEGS